ncbi:MAG TPA: PAS domain S-box protein [Myxococcota bacterium]|nr:PAS domain S-box protein [Myxococcota bacterium]
MSLATALGLVAVAVGASAMALASYGPAWLAAWTGPLPLGAGAALVLAGLAVVLRAHGRARRLALALAASTALLAALALGLPRARGGAQLMDAGIAASLLLAAAGLALFDGRGRRAGRLLAGASAALPATYLLRVLYAAEGVGRFADAVPGPWIALGATLVGFGGLAARADSLVARAAAGRTLGALHLRRVIPAVFGIPAVLGLVMSGWTRWDTVDEPTAFALFALACICALAAASARHAARLDQLARERARLEGLFRRTFENAAVGIAHLDLEGRWLRVNDRLCEIIEQSRDELRYTTLHALLVPEDREVTLAACESLAAGAIDSHRGECRFVTKQGHPHWVELVVSIEREPDGRVEHLVAVVQDVSERKRTEAELELVRRALDGSSDGVVIASTRRPEGEIVFVNPAFERITGLSAVQALGRGWDLLADPAEQGALKERFRRMRRDEGLALLLRGRRPNGEEYCGEIRLAPVADRATGAVTHHVGVLEDVTERMAASSERERLLAQAVSAREEAERAGRAKDEFLALVSHELRSPLGVLASWLPMLRAEAPAELRQRAVTVLHRNVALLTRLIGDLLDASRIASGKLEIERGSVELVRLVRSAVTALQPTAGDRSVELEFSCSAADDVHVDGDAERLDQVVQNLVDNALKFTPAGGRVDVDVALCGEHVELCVRDTGEGIAPEVLPTIFSQFRQGRGGPRGAGRGLGLGLAIVRHLVELHGGTAEAESQGSGRGTCVRIRLPIASAPSVRAPDRAVGEPATLEGVCVLLLEPDRPAAEALAVALEAAEADVAWVRTAADALAQGDALEPDAVVAAFDAEPEEAAELVAGLRASERAGRHVAAIALSTDSTPEARRRAHEAGFEGFVPRPFEPAKLVAAIRRLVRKDELKVLVVDDDRDGADSLGILLERRGFAVRCAYGMAEALVAATRFEPQAAVLDVALGDGDGAQLARMLRVRHPGVRLVALTGSERGDLGSDVAAFDGVVQKPASLAHLVDLLRGR